jgi:maltooligosyltrehalose trehalohydrolase
MSFGAECLEGGGVRFRLWGPKAEKVRLCLQEKLSMPKLDEGWFELCVPEASAGTRYQFEINQQLRVPDPASRFQPQDVHGPSEVIGPEEFDWTDVAWRGRPWEEAVIYELHTGAFTSQGTFAGVESKLDYLMDLGVTAVELMPVSDFPGKRNWGYDGVLPFAPDSSYGRPEDLKRLVQAAHARGLMMFLDVVYNHFGPDGNYLRAYAPEFFTGKHHTPWGEAINFDGLGSRTVRDFFIHNALYWLEEYHFDGLRFDAVHAIVDDSDPDILSELASEVRQKLGSGRHIHLVLENDQNAARYLRRDRKARAAFYDAQWNDDEHHALHVLLTGENGGYYGDYADHPLAHLGRCLAEGFAYQGEHSDFRDGEQRGEPSHHLPSTAFVPFLQNHDQVGNRAFGDRLNKLADPAALKAATAILLLGPSPPLLFMGEEFAAHTPFLFFCDFHDNLAKAVTEGRRNEFKRFSQFSDPAIRARIPDPNAPETFQSSKLNWSDAHGGLDAWLSRYRELLAVRRKEIVPLLRGMAENHSRYEVSNGKVLLVEWRFEEKTLILLANLSSEMQPQAAQPQGRVIYKAGTHSLPGRLGPWSVVWFLA